MSGDGGGNMMSGDQGGGGFMSGDRGGGGFMSGDGGGNMMSGDQGGGGFMSGDGGGGAYGGTVDGGYSREGVVERGGKAVCGAFCCFFIGIPITIMCVFANELNLVKSDATANLAHKAHVVHGCLPSNEDDGHLVYASCAVRCPDISGELPPLLSPFFGRYAGAELEWQLEIYQYDETSHDNCHKNNDGSKTCHRTYSYTAGWHSHPIDSYSFHSRYYNNQNRYGMTSLPDNFKDDAVYAPDHSVLLLSDNGGMPVYSLPSKLAQMFPSRNVYPQNAPDSGMNRWPGSGMLHHTMLRADGDRLVTYGSSPSIGDLRITVSGKTGTKASVAAKQVPSSIGPAFTFTDYPPKPFDFWGRETYPLGRLVDHIESKKEFIKEWLAENSTTAWVFRLILLIVMIVAYRMVLEPISVAADLLRIINCFTCGLGTLLDNAAQSIICMVSCGLGCCVFLFVFAIAWFLVRPTLSVLMLALGLVVFFGLHALKAQQGKAAKAREAEGYVNMSCTPQVVFTGRKVQPTVQVV